MDITVQEAIQDLITALIRSLGSNHGKLLTLMRQCPEGAESLALRVLTIFTEHGRPSAQLVALVKALINERDLDARFLIPIIAEMDKSDIMRYLPRIVSSLNGQPEPKNLVRQVFSSIVTTPPQTFGSVTSNLPRVRQSELLTPAELMVLLHDSEKEIGVKSAIEGGSLALSFFCSVPDVCQIEAIGICFSMTDVFRSEILAVVMQQIMDEPVLPVLFLRTVGSFQVTSSYLRPCVLTLAPGDSSCHDVQVPRRLRVDDAALATDHEENLDKPAVMGGLYPLRQGDRPRELRRAAAAAQGPAARATRQAAEPEARVAGLRDEEGPEQGARGGLPRHLRRGGGRAGGGG